MRRNLNPSVIANLEAVYGSRLKEVSTLTSTQRVLATNLGTRRGLGWKPKDGSVLEFGGKSYVLDLDQDEGTGSIVVPAFDGSMPVMVTIASLCRMCEDTRSVLADKCPEGFVNSLLQRGVSDLWRAEQLYNRAFHVKVFEVEKIDRYRDDKGVLVDRLDENGKPITYQATMVWLNDEVELEEETSSTKRGKSSK